MEKVKLGFVGAGYMGQLAHLVNFVASEKCEVVALAEKREQLGKLVAERYGIKKVYRDHLELCNDPEVQAIAAITSDDVRAPISIDIMNAGKHVFLEKPMATCVDDAEKMVEASQKNGVKLVISYMKRYDPGVEGAKEIINSFRENGEIGNITFVRAHCFGGDWVCNLGKHITTEEPYPRGQTKLPDWLHKEDSGKFLGFNNVYCHNLNLLRFMTGDVKELKFADLASPTYTVLLDMEGFSANLELGRISANRWDEQLKIYFSDGWVDVLTPSPLLRNVPATVEVYKAGKIQEVQYPFSTWDWSFKRADEHFLDCIIEDKEPRSSGADSLKDMRLIEEIFKRFGRR